MRHWERATRAQLCGRCGVQISNGAPIQTITMSHLKAHLVRCEGCAQGQAPPDLPAVPVRGRTTSRMQPVKKLAERFDWKAAAGGDR